MYEYFFNVEYVVLHYISVESSCRLQRSRLSAFGKKWLKSIICDVINPTMWTNTSEIKTSDQLTLDIILAPTCQTNLLRLKAIFKFFDRDSLMYIVVFSN